MKICALCGEKLKKGKTIQTYEIEKRIITVRNIPAFICKNCGEAYLEAETVNTLDELIDELKIYTFSTIVIDYPGKVKI